MELFDFIALLVSQVEPPSVTPSAKDGLANILLWALSAVSTALSAVALFLFNAYKKARDTSDSNYKEQITSDKHKEKDLLEAFTKSTEATTTLNNTLQNVLNALQSMDRRIEDVERKFD